MSKIKKVVLIADRNDSNLTAYLNALPKTDYIVKVTGTSEEFLQGLSDYAPNIIVLNEESLGSSIGKVITLLKSDSITSQIPIILLEVKNSAFKNLKDIERLQLPLNNAGLNQIVKKVAKKFELLEVEVEEDNEAFASFYAEIVALNEASFKISTQFKFTQGSKIRVESPFLHKMGIDEKRFVIEEDSKSKNGDIFVSQVSIRGTDINVHKKLKEYYNSAKVKKGD